MPVVGLHVAATTEPSTFISYEDRARPLVDTTAEIAGSWIETVEPSAGAIVPIWGATATVKLHA